MSIRTKTTREAEKMAFEKLSSWSLVAGVSRELYRRFSTEMWAVLAFGELAVIIFNKIG